MSARARRALALLLAALALCAGAGLLWGHRLARPFETRLTAAARPPLRAARAPSPWPRGTVNVNTADAQALTALSGVGPKLAQAIVAERATNGVFCYPEDLLAVKGIGEKKLAAFRAQLDFGGAPGVP